MNIPDTEKKESYMDVLRGDRRTMVTHYRYVNDNGTIRLLPLYEIRNKGLQRQVLSNGGGVKVIMSENDSNWIGYSYCSLEDRFLKRSGNTMAFQNALRKLDAHKNGELIKLQQQEEYTQHVLQKLKRRLPKVHKEELISANLPKVDHTIS